MNDEVKMVEEMLTGGLDSSSVLHRLEEKLVFVSSQNGDHAKELFCLRCALRLVKCYRQFVRNKASERDLVVALRNFILYYASRVRLNADLMTRLAPSFEEFGLSREFDDTANCSLSVPGWFSQQSFVNTVFWKETAQGVSTQTAIGDGYLKKLTGFAAYRSFEQKAAVQAAFRLPPGYTLLASLPTGGGKSLITQTIAFASEGLTVVIVPTVALAIDQVRAARKDLKNVATETNVACYYGGMAAKTIVTAIQNGELKLLFISPEALMRNKSIHDAIYETANNQRLSNIVIDEAHLIPEWGDLFRPDFQCFSIMRRKLLEASGGTVRTFLLSATLTENAVTLLKTMYADDATYVEVRAESLRSEPRYCYVGCKDRADKRTKLMRLAAILPRPMILYVVSPDDAEYWKKALMQTGFSRVTTFTGDTPDTEREQIIRDWNNNEYDIIVATSAFGMGVDKPDVRTVLHACVPENPNRYYQELGRAGRDGLPSLSVLCVEKGPDIDAAFNMISKKVMTRERALARWKGMTQGRNVALYGGNKYFLDTSSPPIDLAEDTPTGLRNIQWNINAVLFLYRYGYIRLTDIFFDVTKSAYMIEAELTDVDLMTDESRLIQRLDEDRQSEWSKIERDFRRMANLIHDPKDECWSYTFTSMYRYAAESCAGCPGHRDAQFYVSQYMLHKKIQAKGYVATPSRSISSLMGRYREMILEPQKYPRGEVVSTALQWASEHVIPTVVLASNILSMLNWTNVVSSDQPMLLLTTQEFEEITKGHWFLVGSTVLCVYGNDEAENNRLYAMSRKLLAHTTTNVVHCCSKDLYIVREGRYMKDNIEGYTMALDAFVGAENIV